jgi:glutamyl-tRNA synthetase
MAPSPTGNLHLGTAYATLWPYLWARKNNGVFILRIEDTDRDRSTEEFEGKIIDGLKWLGYDWDEGPYHQMDRLDLYKDKLDFLISSGGAYKCFCTKEELDAERKLQQVEKLPQVYSGRCRNAGHPMAK